MARDFDGSATQYGIATAPVTAVPFTLACRVNLDTITPAFQNFFGIFNDGGTNVGHYLSFEEPSASRPLWAFSTAASDWAGAVTTNFPTVGSWNSCVGRWASATSRNCVLNGDLANSGSNTTSRSPAGINNAYLGVYYAISDALDGKIAEVAVWNSTLVDDEVVAFHRGYSPLLIKRANLVAYWPLVGRYSPEIDIIGRRDFTLTGPPGTSVHAPVFYPRRRSVSRPPQTFLQSISSPAVGAVTLQRQGNIVIPVVADRHSVTVTSILVKIVSVIANAAHIAAVQRQGNLVLQSASGHAVSLQRQGNIIVAATARHAATVASQLVKIVSVLVAAVRSSSIQRQANLILVPFISHAQSIVRQGAIALSHTSSHAVSLQRRGSLFLGSIRKAAASLSTIFVSGSGYKQGMDFRNTAAFVVDPPDHDEEISTTANYPSITAQGNTVGWETAPTGTRNRNAGIDARLAGIHFRTDASPANYRFELPSTGPYRIRVAVGDASFAQNSKVELLDNVTSIGVICDGATGVGQFFDASGVLRTSAADWASNNTAIIRNMTSTTLRIRVGGATTVLNGSVIAHVYVEAIGSVTAIATAVMRATVTLSVTLLHQASAKFTGGAALAYIPRKLSARWKRRPRP